MRNFRVYETEQQKMVKVVAANPEQAALTAAGQLLQIHYPEMSFREVYSCTRQGEAIWNVHLKANCGDWIQYSPRLLVTSGATL